MTASVNVALSSSLQQVEVVAHEQDAVAHRDAEQRDEADHAGDRDHRRLVALAAEAEGKVEVEGRAAAYVCRRGVCERPVTSAADLAIALR